MDKQVTYTWLYIPGCDSVINCTTIKILKTNNSINNSQSL